VSTLGGVRGGDREESPYSIVDLPRFMDEGGKWTRLFRETFTVR